jgi:NADH-quinone oxidoreductase subunit N|uniref:NADH dehydrogenase subunit 2 n=1 Tax=Sundstroemia setigera TaxID=3005 RepID=A0A8A6KFK4_9STRA|nr:NADH dehydrogenase subunit 2 [Rhizosolenia setigera]QTI82397.1 NADH dehydrogenase subunit 2 [Rhizosolenia setigera]WAQ69960.1 NADH dehydrogenase subunit 2 [Rhizosolenia setigera]WAQ69996.1 NADH dehydrogenase subunit 2 [Rhizosolenia setigera]WAQ70032.1 NADH dehydrogenase subunit 2 [Rhizosolenia setigera]WAQ70068.1 NADH dehydrogenase subunit 2 [Rhizosolenia setigera]
MNNLLILKNIGILPELFLCFSILFLLIFGSIISTKSPFYLVQSAIQKISLLILLLTIVLLINNYHYCVKDFIFFNNTLISDYLSFFSKIVISVFSFLCLTANIIYINHQKLNNFEYFIIKLLAILGFLILCSSNDLITTYLAIELQSLSFYVMASIKKSSSFSVDAGLKYFILGSFSSAILLLGSSFIYGSTGTINFEDLKSLFYFQNFTELNMLNLGLIFFIISLFFKLSIAPVHLWSPDVYENSPTSSTIFFAVVSKLSILIILFRFYIYGLKFFTGIDWYYLFVFFSVLSIFLGSVTAITQKKLKSLLAYSSISHLGYIFLSFCSGSFESIQSMFMYLFIYMLGGCIVWSIFLVLQNKKNYNYKHNKDLTDLKSLIKSNSLLTFIFSITLLSITGFPPLIGFFIKINIFLSALELSSIFPVFLISLISVISAFYYIRIIKILYFEKGICGNLYKPMLFSQSFIIILMFFLIIYLFIDPTILYLITYKLSLLCYI